MQETRRSFFPASGRRCISQLVNRAVMLDEENAVCVPVQAEIDEGHCTLYLYTDFVKAWVNQEYK